MTDSKCFYAFRVECQKELATRTFLKKRHFAVCVPRKTIKRRAGPKGRSGPYKEIKKVAAPGYVFVYLPKDNPQMHRLFAFRAIRSVVEFDGIPGQISKTSMARFLRALGEKPQEAEPTIFRKGDDIRVKDGPLADRRGRITEAKGERLILELVDGPRVRISKHQVERVEVSSEPSKVAA